VKPEIREIPFRSLPGLSRLYLEYLDLSPDALRFYPQPPTAAGILKLAREHPPRLAFARAEMQPILERQNAALGAGDRTFANIRDLKADDCVAVVTGQQAGLFTGPLYTVYKALCALRIVEFLRAENVKAVPVFWIECEDHDLAEVTHGSVVAPDGTVRRLDYRERLYGGMRESARPVGTLTLSDAIREVTAEYAGFLQDGSKKEEVRSLLEKAYRPGALFADAFGTLMAGLFRESGLVFFNPGDLAAKRIAAPVFQEALGKTDEIHRRLSERSRDLESAGYHRQVSMQENSTVLFLLEEDERRALIRNGPRFGLKGVDRTWTSEELLELAARCPERFSPSVLLRPLVQDHLFPTVAYVGGPSEVAYFAQIEVLYRLLNRTMPVIFPRASFTLLEPEVRAAMAESGVHFEDCLQGRQTVIEKVMASGTGAKIKSLEETLERTLSEIRPELVLAEASLGPALDTALRKMQHNLAALHSRLIQTEARQNGTVSRSADLILNHCFPNKNLQERELGAPFFLARHGRQLLDAVYSQVQLESFAHRLVALEAPSGNPV